MPVPGQIEDASRKFLLHVTRIYAAHKNLAIATVARRFHGADSFLDDFETGERTVTLRKYDEMIEALKADWPDGVKWPKKK